MLLVFGNILICVSFKTSLVTNFIYEKLSGSSLFTSRAQRTALFHVYLGHRGCPGVGKVVLECLMMLATLDFTSLM